MDAALFEAEQMLQLSDVPQAKRVLSDIIAATSIEEPGHLDALGLLARCLIVMGELERAVAVLGNIIDGVSAEPALAAAYAMTWAVRAALHASCGRRREALRDAVAAFQNGDGEYPDEQAALAWGSEFVAQLAEDSASLKQAGGDSRGTGPPEGDDTADSMLSRMQGLFGAATRLMEDEDFNGAEKTLTEAVSVGGKHVDIELACVCLSTRAFCRIMDGKLGPALVDLNSVIDSASQVNGAGTTDSSAIISPTLVARAVLHRIMANMPASETDTGLAIAAGVSNAQEQVDGLFEAWTDTPMVQQAMQGAAADATLLDDLAQSFSDVFDTTQAQSAEQGNGVEMLQAAFRCHIERRKYVRVREASLVIQNAARRKLARRRRERYSTAKAHIATDSSLSGQLAIAECELSDERSLREQCEAQIKELQAQLGEQWSNSESDSNSDFLQQELKEREEQLKRAGELGQSLLVRNDALQNDNADLKAERDQISSANEEHEYVFTRPALCCCNHRALHCCTNVFCCAQVQSERAGC